MRVKLESSGKIQAVPEYLQVDFTENKASRDYFTISEGVYKDQNASMKEGNLRSGSIHTGPAILTFDKTNKQLTYNGVDTVSATTDDSYPIAVGDHPIQLPDFPHTLANVYADETAYPMSWCYLGVGHAVPGNNDRYLHPGNISAGCVSVAPSGWTPLYEYLILSRNGDGKNVGKITVK